MKVKPTHYHTQNKPLWIKIGINQQKSQSSNVSRKSKNDPHDPSLTSLDYQLLNTQPKKLTPKADEFFQRITEIGFQCVQVSEESVPFKQNTNFDLSNCSQPQMSPATSSFKYLSFQSKWELIRNLRCQCFQLKEYVIGQKKQYQVMLNGLRSSIKHYFEQIIQRYNQKIIESSKYKNEHLQNNKEYEDLLKQHEEITQSYQKILMEKAYLEIRIDKLEEEKQKAISKISEHQNSRLESQKIKEKLLQTEQTLKNLQKDHEKLKIQIKQTTNNPKDSQKQYYSEEQTKNKTQLEKNQINTLRAQNSRLDNIIQLLKQKLKRQKDTSLDHQNISIKQIIPIRDSGYQAMLLENEIKKNEILVKDIEQLREKNNQNIEINKQQCLELIRLQTIQRQMEQYKQEIDFQKNTIFILEEKVFDLQQKNAAHDIIIREEVRKALSEQKQQIKLKQAEYLQKIQFMSKQIQRLILQEQRHRLEQQNSNQNMRFKKIKQQSQLQRKQNQLQRKQYSSPNTSLNSFRKTTKNRIDTDFSPRHLYDEQMNSINNTPFYKCKTDFESLIEKLESEKIQKQYFQKKREQSQRFKENTKQMQIGREREIYRQKQRQRQIQMQMQRQYEKQQLKNQLFRIKKDLEAKSLRLEQQEQRNRVKIMETELKERSLRQRQSYLQRMLDETERQRMIVTQREYDMQLEEQIIEERIRNLQQKQEIYSPIREKQFQKNELKFRERSRSPVRYIPKHTGNKKNNFYQSNVTTSQRNQSQKNNNGYLYGTNKDITVTRIGLGNKQRSNITINGNKLKSNQKNNKINLKEASIIQDKLERLKAQINKQISMIK